jgi:hypothetical protein
MLTRVSKLSPLNKFPARMLAWKLLHQRPGVPERFQISFGGLQSRAVQALHSVDRGPDNWAWHVASRLEEIAVPVLGGSKLITRFNATAIRIAALCLAAEAELEPGPLWEITAGVTLLEQRQNGEVPVTEGIMLAIA